MKSTLSAGLIAILLGVGVFSLSSTAEAYYRSGYYCKIVPAHWANGHLYPTREVCWRGQGRGHCKWVPGYWQHGYWHEAHTVCRYRYY